MATTEKSNLPAYASYSSFISFINGLRESGIPMQIDRSVMPKASGSQISTTIATLRFLKLIDVNSKPTALMKQLVEAADEARGPILAKIIQQAYGFLIGDSEFDLEKATGQQVADKFRAQDVTGSTVSKSVAFFLSAAKAAGIKVSPHIKPPAPPRSENKRGKKNADDGYIVVDDDDNEEVERFVIPIPGKRSATVIVPKDLSTEDWDMLNQMLNLYIKRLQSENQ
jgi:hypothetical protein